MYIIILVWCGVKKDLNSNNRMYTRLVRLVFCITKLNKI